MREFSKVRTSSINSTMTSSYEEAVEAKGYLPFHLDSLPPRMMQRAKQEINETEEIRASSLKKLRKLILDEKDLNARSDDAFLLQFLRARKFDVDKAFARYQNMFHVCSKSFPDVYAKSDVDNTIEAFRSGISSHLPYRDEEGASVILVKMNKWDTSKHDAASFVNALTALVLSAVDEPASQVCGLHVFVDASGTNVHHIRTLTPRYLYLVSKGLRDTLPARYKSIQLFNASLIFRYLWGILYIFLPEKMKKRVHVHGSNPESLHKFIPKAILPTEYGGDNPNFDLEAWGPAKLERFVPKYVELLRGGYTTT
ncbi:alpha-tocopherol transfer protein-like [Caerostris extrusa]|uniref:Alpha-tocopherol transfer protein-like n=1 Tax=Caerostris extrusa TaxID=172846 RepID=A0AAV4RSX9_CAEEX|nr:alpha-tocopherol transfer protein-like [Caerostris extrusa]